MAEVTVIHKARTLVQHSVEWSFDGKFHASYKKPIIVAEYISTKFMMLCVVTFDHKLPIYMGW